LLSFVLRIWYCSDIGDPVVFFKLCVFFLQDTFSYSM
jgi:hypothetical protein